jgi:fused signal recognition particle receptor
MIYCTPMVALLSRWRESLSRTRKSAFGRLATLLGATQIDAQTWEDLESLLIQADMGAETTMQVIAALQDDVVQQGLRRADELRLALAAELRKRLVPPPPLDWIKRPTVVLVVGVNGSGKTTTIAKLANFLGSTGKSVLLGAADTFRAAAVEQLEVWGTLLGVDVVSGAADGDPGAVVFNAIQAGVARGMDVILIDTAGRLHTRFNLMEEIKKVHRVAGRALEGAPHAVWLVLDATTGQNALAQARAFKEAVGVTGVILAKLDASARGGMAFSIQRELGLPILFVGVGEGLEDLQFFDPDAFVNGILE